ncbi:hypothetical protein LNK15_15640, partial [Jeotgalicoccus huakuii]|nr:hypothetical protein [Jeotgalicoccus huakuii]
ADLDQVIGQVAEHLRSQYPDMQAQPQRFSLGSTDTGTAAYRINGPDSAVLRRLAGQIAQALRGLPGTQDVRDDWGPS